ncbi:MAG: hypothetical protein KJ065_07815 [Anaerolineae bacterium]|nr:hypothetical protein [Anaerolineae bacterium]
MEDRPKPGRKTKADDKYVRLLEAALATDPQQLGLAYHVWTLTICSCCQIGSNACQKSSTAQSSSSRLYWDTFFGWNTLELITSSKRCPALSIFTLE